MSILIRSNCREKLEKLERDRSLLIRKLGEMTADRNEWREQHENLLAMYRAEVAKRHPSESTVLG